MEKFCVQVKFTPDLMNRFEYLLWTNIVEKHKYIKFVDFIKAPLILMGIIHIGYGLYAKIFNWLTFAEIVALALFILILINRKRLSMIRIKGLLKEKAGKQTEYLFDEAHVVVHNLTANTINELKTSEFNSIFKENEIIGLVATTEEGQQMILLIDVLQLKREELQQLNTYLDVYLSHCTAYKWNVKNRRK